MVLLAGVLGLMGMTCKDEPAGEESGKPSLLFVIYPESGYIAKGDMFICEASGISKQELSAQWRRSIESAMHGALNKQFNTTSLGLVSTPGGQLDSAYSFIQWRQTKRQLKSHSSSKPQRSVFNPFRSKRAKYGTDCVNTIEVPPARRIFTFADISLTDTTIFNEMNARHKTEYILVLTQLEMNTRFSNCLDMRGSVHLRDIYLHYVFMDSTGRRLDAGIVGNTYYNSTNSAEQVIKENLGPLTKLIIGNIQQHI